MRWKITIEGLDEFSGRDTAEMVIEKDVGRLSKGEIGLTIADGKSIMACLQQLVVKQQCEAYVLTSWYCTDCQTFRRIKDYGKRKIRTVYERVEVSNPRIMYCRRCVPYFCDASAVLRDICPDQATPELMELSARLGSLMPYRKAADVLAEFLPIPSTESFMTLRHRTMKLGERLDEKARRRAYFEPPSSSEHTQVELDLPNDPEREFVVSIDTAHVRCSRLEKARTFEIAVARCGRGRRGSPPALLCDSRHIETRITIASASSAPTRGLRWTWRNNRNLRRRRDHEASAQGSAEADGAHHRLIPHRDENSAYAANRRSYCALSRRMDQCNGRFGRRDSHPEMEAVARTGRSSDAAT